MTALTSPSVVLSLLIFVTLRSLLKKRDTKGHPLPPGPPPLPYVGNIFGVNFDHPWLAHLRWGAEYGEICYSRLFSQDIVTINSERVAHELLDCRSNNYSTRPPSLLRVLDFIGIESDSVFLPYSDLWRLHRKILHQAFRSEVTPSFRPIQMRKSHDMILNLLHFPLEYRTHLHTFSTSIILSIVYDYTTLSRDDPFVELVEHSLEVSGKVLRPEVAAILGEFPILGKLPSWFPGASFVKSAQVHRSILPKAMNVPFEYVKKNMANGTAMPSMVSDALYSVSENAKNDHEAVLIEQAIKDASYTGYVAASETTMATLCVFLFAMVLYPDVQTRAQEEIDVVIGGDLKRLPEWDDRASMPYIEAVIRETLRWFPVIPLVPHATVNDDIYEGYYIPKGATVFANTWAMARNPKIYPNPTRFIPERHMLKAASERSRKDGNGDLFTFGFGRRICVGRYLADASLYAAIVNILAVFRVERTPGWNIGPDGEGVEWTGGMTTHPVFPCIFTPRHSNDRIAELIKDAKI